MKKIIQKIASVVSPAGEAVASEQGIQNDPSLFLGSIKLTPKEKKKYTCEMDIFKDMTPEGLYHDYAIELEVSHESGNQAVKPVRNSESGHLYMKTESSRIVEVSGIHKMKQKSIEKIYNYLQDTYKDKLPIGNDGNLSGGVHYHIFMNTATEGFKKFYNKYYVYGTFPSKQLEENRGNCKKFNRVMAHNFKNLPLNFKLYDGHLIGRYNMKNNFEWVLDRIGSTSSPDSLEGRGLTWGYKPWSNPPGSGPLEFLAPGNSSSAFYPKLLSIEFRLNQVVDVRLYGYYVGLYLLALNGIKLEKLENIDFNQLTAKEPNFKRLKGEMTPSILSRSNVNTFYDDEVLDENYNVHCDKIISKMKSAYKLKDETKKGMIENLKTIHKVLLANGLEKASEKLFEYQTEYSLI